METTKYVDGFVLVVPKDKAEAYIKMANDGKSLWMKHGALAYFECRGDDLVPKEMGGAKPLGFKELAKASDDEDVWFSFITYASKEHRDEVNAKVLEEMGAQADAYKDMIMPFEMNRMAYGGFAVEVSGE
ncbi:hypothetical protein A3C87_00355 [Candidatus Kaiserbacteria bacterium RIFCSPHIGHO2_02_FULL_49_34]|uniref:RNA signal recognition particle n=1 Tax=Candidatus Kaiserbacteria bacterium RIFCSPHIGHO2_02_FULL_49_34 TaxID=1798491 RepID=A0A1F6DK81_9BACT|nr:MAG: hypothetical protein A3C87_00355 [Candidatus Kaiserbacteria bacterium RIFCSPHIGHO2_02_FULL_49_34]